MLKKIKYWVNYSVVAVVFAIIFSILIDTESHVLVPYIQILVVHVLAYLFMRRLSRYRDNRKK